MRRNKYWEPFTSKELDALGLLDKDSALLNFLLRNADVLFDTDNLAVADVVANLADLGLDGSAKWVHSCYNMPPLREVLMAAFDDVLGRRHPYSHGVESISDEKYRYDKYYGNSIASYVNRGDTYAATIVHDHDNDVFLVTSWGDFVEDYDRIHLEDTDDRQED